MLTARENIIKTLRCDNPEWIPVTAYCDPFNISSEGVPEELREIFENLTWEKSIQATLALSKYLGVNEYWLGTPAPYNFRSSCDIERKTEDNKAIAIIHTSKGDLRRVTTTVGRESFATERYIKGPEDLPAYLEYYQSLKFEPDIENLKRARELKNIMGDKGVLNFGFIGTPLSVMYREATDITQLAYLLMDLPEQMKELFACIEEKTLQGLRYTLENAPEIDVFTTVDDTSTTLISPNMFEEHNLELTNTRADLIHEYGKIYLHHSCGLIHDLLPVYRKTRMDGVHAFTTPPIGDVEYEEGRKLLGDKISIFSSLLSGIQSNDEQYIEEFVRKKFEAGKKAGNIMFSAGGGNRPFSVIEKVFNMDFHNDKKI